MAKTGLYERASRVTWLDRPWRPEHGAQGWPGLSRGDVDSVATQQALLVREMRARLRRQSKRSSSPPSDCGTAPRKSTLNPSDGCFVYPPRAHLQRRLGNELKAKGQQNAAARAFQRGASGERRLGGWITSASRRTSFGLLHQRISTRRRLPLPRHMCPAVCL